MSDQVPDDVSVKNAEAIQFAQENLKIYGKSITALQADNAFREKLYSLVEESFDGERNVLFRTLLSEEQNPMASKLRREISKLNQSATNALINVDGKNYYPQVYIPFYDDLKEKGILSTKTPILIIYTDDSPTSLYLGYSINDQGDLVATEELISENFAKENEVWVISINERVDSDGNLKENITTDRTQGASYPHARFVTIKIDSHKEEWAAGASEVHIKRYLSFYRYDLYSSNPAVLNVTSEDDLPDGDGWRIKEVKRNDVGKTLTVNWAYVADWPNRYYNFPDGSSYHTDYFYYVVFEYDPWPTGMRTASMPDLGLSGFVIPTNYRSADTYYKQSYIPEYGANTWTSTVGFHFTSQY